VAHGGARRVGVGEPLGHAEAGDRRRSRRPFQRGALERPPAVAPALDRRRQYPSETVAQMRATSLGKLPARLVTLVTVPQVETVSRVRW
jgi:hypothetical protein